MRLFYALFGLLATMALASAGRAAPVSAYAVGPAIDTVRLSPDGQMIAYSTHRGDEPHVIVQQLDERKLVADVVLPGVNISDLRWAGLKNLLVLTLGDDLVQGFDEAQLLVQAIDLTSLKSIDLLRDQPFTANVLLATPVVRVSADGTATALLIAPEAVGGFAFNLYEANLKTGRSKLLGRGIGSGAVDWQVDADGAASVQIQYELTPRRWTIAEKRGMIWKPIVNGVGYEPSFVGVTPGGLPIVWFPSEFGASVRTVNPDGSLKDLLPGEGYGGLLGDPAAQRVYGAWRKRAGGLEYHFIERSDQVRWAGIVAAYGGAHLDWISESDDHKRLVVLVTPKGEPPYYGLVDLATGKARDIGDLYAGVSISDTSPTSWLTFKASDGVSFEGYLTTPRNRPAKGLPLVVIPPSYYSSWATGEFDADHQALASRGYAVLNVNYRGLGSPAATPAVGQLGGKSISDLGDAVRQLVKDGLVDPARVCIWGRGYLGGYSALAAAIRDPDVYHCVVADNGVLDLREWANLMWAKDKADWLRRFGVPQWSDPRLVEMSPLLQANKVRASVLLITETQDRGRIAGQTRLMEKALKKARVNVESFEREGDNAQRAAPSARVKALEAVVRFLEKNNPPT